MSKNYYRIRKKKYEDEIARLRTELHETIRVLVDEPDSEAASKIRMLHELRTKGGYAPVSVNGVDYKILIIAPSV